MSREVRYLDLADLLLIAEVVLGTPAEELKRSVRLDLAESALHAPQAGYGEVEFYPAFHSKVAVLGARIIKNHPFTDGNRRIGFLAMIEFVERNGCAWRAPEADDPAGDETVAVIEGLAAGTVTEDVLAAWVAQRLAGAG